ncbi:Hypothetical_protein [Hexamita inflata]|uniref:Hypothetical_protein n=1 Tax=Hexamita inflata TaxID=28002 RepID=A0AA86NU42_9EUKA|nr:Hypothetical protein HINF_LOCUS13251 [Hexamita inflata]CAI9966750.1 Hypothetical protein HINF_LOCUS54395 [Hexamita inflata]
MKIYQISTEKVRKSQKCGQYAVTLRFGIRIQIRAKTGVKSALPYGWRALFIRLQYTYSFKNCKQINQSSFNRQLNRNKRLKWQEPDQIGGDGLLYFKVICLFGLKNKYFRVKYEKQQTINDKRVQLVHCASFTAKSTSSEQLLAPPFNREQVKSPVSSMKFLRISALLPGFCSSAPQSAPHMPIGALPPPSNGPSSSINGFQGVVNAETTDQKQLQCVRIKLLYLKIVTYVIVGLLMKSQTHNEVVDPQILLQIQLFRQTQYQQKQLKYHG